MFQCSTCPTKIHKVKFWCIQCKKCYNCCACTCLIFVDRKLKFYQAPDKERKINSSSRFVAAELEVAGVKVAVDDRRSVVIGNRAYIKLEELANTLNKWGCSIVEDGSLPYCGFEINTSPASGDFFVKQVNAITTKLKEAKAIITKDCGLHIHIDARDYNFYDIAKLIKIYAALERVFFAMVPVHRKKSGFCLPCGKLYKDALADGDTYILTKSSVVFGTYNNYDSNTSRKSKYNNARYNALNLHSWFYRGTIEFRLMEGSIDPNYIINWGMLWAKLLDWVLQASDKDVDKAVVKLKGNNPALMLDAIIGEELVDWADEQIMKHKVKPKKRPAKKR